MKALLLSALLLVPLPAAAATWTVDYPKSRLGFSVQWSGQPFVATFKSWQAEIAFDPADLAKSHAIVRIDLSSEGSDSPDNDDGVKGAEGFAVDKFPAATFTTTAFSQTSPGNYVATGTLDLHGIAKAITLPFHLDIKGNTAHMVGKATVSRIDFGLGHGEWAGETPIAHAVTIDVDLTATKIR